MTSTRQGCASALRLVKDSKGQSRYRDTHTRSSAMAMPCPTPMHMVESERLPWVWRNSSAAVPVILAPDMPKG